MGYWAFNFSGPCECSCFMCFGRRHSLLCISSLPVLFSTTSHRFLCFSAYYFFSSALCFCVRFGGFCCCWSSSPLFTCVYKHSAAAVDLAVMRAAVVSSSPTLCIISSL
ncbi:hypothetical protein LINPERPRIM_LOCUS30769, partial [Linum perenne]